jgi:hypothetical protein
VKLTKTKTRKGYRHAVTSAINSTTNESMSRLYTSYFTLSENPARAVLYCWEHVSPQYTLGERYTSFGCFTRKITACSRTCRSIGLAGKIANPPDSIYLILKDPYNFKLIHIIKICTLSYTLEKTLIPSFIDDDVDVQ